MSHASHPIITSKDSLLYMYETPTTIQLPYLPLYTTKILNHHRYLHFYIIGYALDPSIHAKLCELHEMDERAHEWFDQKNPKIQWNQSIDLEKCSLRMKISSWNDAIIYDQQKLPLSWSSVKIPCQMRSIVLIRGIWFNHSTQKAGIDIECLQLQFYAFVSLVEYSFSEKPTRKKKLEEHPVFGKYFKMQALKIPPSAIRQKLILHNHPLEILDCTRYEDLDRFTLSIEKDNREEVVVLNSVHRHRPILSTTTTPSNTTNTNKSLVITQEEILSIKSKLKKIM